MLTGDLRDRDPLAGAPVVFGVLLENAAENWLGRNQLMRSLAADRDVIYLQRSRDRSIGVPRLRQIGPREFALEGAFRLGDAPRLRRVQALTRVVDGWLFARGMRRAGYDDYVFWLGTPTPSMLAHHRPLASVFDLVDPCLTPGLEPEFDANVRAAAHKADVTFVTAEALARKVRSVGVEPVVIPNAAREEDVQATLDRGEARHVLGLEAARVAGYLGTIDGRVDLGLVAETARRLPDWHLLIAGRVNADRRAEADRTAELPNVTIMGSVDVETGQRVIAACDVCFIPFYEDEIGDAINPVKMFTYLSLDRPVVATNIEECRRNPIVSTASGARDFAAALERCVESDRNGTARRSFVQANTWDARARQAVASIRDVILHKRARDGRR